MTTSDSVRPLTAAGQRLVRSGFWTKYATTPTDWTMTFVEAIRAIEDEARAGSLDAATLAKGLRILADEGHTRLRDRPDCKRFGVGLGGGSRSGYECTCGKDQRQAFVDAALREAQP